MRDLLGQVGRLMGMAVHVGRQRLALARGVRRLMHVLGLRSSPSGPRRQRIEDGRRLARSGERWAWQGERAVVYVGRVPAGRRRDARGCGQGRRALVGCALRWARRRAVEVVVDGAEARCAGGGSGWGLGWEDGEGRAACVGQVAEGWMEV